MIETLLHQSGFAVDNSSALALLLSPLYLVFILVGCVIMGYPLYVAGQRANHPNPWFGFIPILNLVILCQLAGVELWMIILCFIPCVNICVLVYMWWKFAEKMGKPGPVALCIFVPILNILMPYYIVFM